MAEDEIERFWAVASSHARITWLPGYLPPTMRAMVTPPAWSFGTTPEQADRLLALVLDGTKTATASDRAAYDDTGEPLPEPGTLGIVLDGAGHPQALVETIEVRVVAFDDVPEDHAHAEGEGDRTLAHWREAHRAFFTADGQGFSPDMPVVLERFRVLHRA